MKSSHPVISAIVPAYERPALLEQAVRSVLDQTYESWELMVCDDGSPKDSVSFVSALDDPRVHLVRVPHSGNPGRVRNVGLKRAVGRYVSFLDSDDLWDPEKLRLQIEWMEQAPQCRWSYTGFRMIDDRGHRIAARAGGPWQPHSGMILPQLVTTEAAVVISSLMVERSLLTEVGGFDEEFSARQDYDLVLRLALSSPVVAVPQPLCAVRDHSRRVTTTQDDPHWLSAAVLVKLGRTNLPRRIHRAVNRRCHEHLMASAGWHLASGHRGRAILAFARGVRYRPLLSLVQALLLPIRRLRRAYRTR